MWARFEAGSGVPADDVKFSPSLLLGEGAAERLENLRGRQGRGILADPPRGAARRWQGQPSSD